MRANGHPIPEVSKLRILGLLIQNTGRNSETLGKLESAVLQTLRLIMRISNKHAGMKEVHLHRLVQTFVLSRVTYTLPYLRLTSSEKARVETLLRKVYKVATGLPTRTSTAKLFALGVHNTLDEMTEAHLTAQYERLSQTSAGRFTLTETGIRYTPTMTPKIDIPLEQRQHLKITPIPRNMHPIHHKDRRADRAKTLHTKFKANKAVTYVDAAEIPNRPAFSIAVVNNEGRLMSGGSIKAANSEVAEEAAIALAIATTTSTIIISDSKSAVRNFARGRISPTAKSILNRNRNHRTIQIIWAPAHESLPGNEAAHNQARAFILRAEGHRPTGDEVTGPESPGLSARDRMVTYQEITQHYRLARLVYPPAHKTLTKRQEIVWRQLQTNTFPTPFILSRINPSVYSSCCKLCQRENANLYHILWGCSETQQPNNAQGSHITTPQQWEATLLSSDPETQVRVTEWAEAAARAQGLLAA